MKKLIFGLIATVLLSSLSYGSLQCQLQENQSIEITNVKEKVFDDFVRLRCIHAYFEVSYYGATFGVDGYICCWRASSHELKWDCDFFTSPPSSPIIAYIDVETFNAKMLDKINSGESDKISISNSKLGEYEGRFYKVLDGEYTIEKDENGRFIEVKIIEVAN